MVRLKVLTMMLISSVILFLLLPVAQAEEVKISLIDTPSGGGCAGTACDPYLVSVQPVDSTPPYNPTGAAVDMLLNCDDFNDHISVFPSYWIADVMPGSQDLSGTEMAVKKATQWATTGVWTGSSYSGTITANEVYDMKAYIEAFYGPNVNPAYTVAIWSLFDPSLKPYLPSGADPILAAAYAFAQADQGTGYLTYRQYLTVYSPVSTIFGGPYAGDQPQELDTVPDGGVTLMLLGGALVGLETLRRKLHV